MSVQDTTENWRKRSVIVCGVGGTCCGVICVVREIYGRVVVVCWVQWCVLRMCGVRGVGTSIVTKQFVFLC